MSKYTLWAILLVSTLPVMAGAIIAPGLPLIADYFLDKGGDTRLVQFVLTMPALAIFLSGSFIGRLSDRIGRKPILIAGLLFYSLFGFAGYFIDDINILILSRALLGLSVACVMTMGSSIISDIVEGKDRSKIMGYQAAAMAMGGVVFLLAGGLMAEVSWRMPFLIYLLALPICLFSQLVIPETHHHKNKKDFKDDKDANKLTSIHFRLSISLCLGMIIFYVVPTTFPFYLKEVFNLGPKSSGVGVALGSVAGVIASLNYKNLQLHWKDGHIIQLIFSTIAVGYFCIGNATNEYWAVLGVIISGVGAGLMLPHFSYMMGANSNDSIRGKSFGLLTASLFLGQFASPIITRPMGAIIGNPLLFSGVGAVALILGYIGSWLRWSNKNESLV